MNPMSSKEAGWLKNMLPCLTFGGCSFRTPVEHPSLVLGSPSSTVSLPLANCPLSCSETHFQWVQGEAVAGGGDQEDKGSKSLLCHCSGFACAFAASITSFECHHSAKDVLHSVHLGDAMTVTPVHLLY